MATRQEFSDNSVIMPIDEGMASCTMFDADGDMVWDRGELMAETTHVATGEDFTPDDEEEVEKYSQEFESKHPRDDKGMFKDVSDIGELEHIKDLGGTTGAAMYKHKKTGKHYVVKGGGKGGPERVASEVLADSIYQLLGAKVPNSGMISSDEGSKKISEMLTQPDSPVQTLAEWRQGKPMSEVKEMYQKIAKHFVADCLLANWDVIGLESDNILVAEGIPYRVDNGGALRFRAQGGKKGSFFGPDVNELRTMRESTTNASSAKVFKHLLGEDVIQQISHVLHNETEIMQKVQKMDPASVELMHERFQFLRNLLHVHAEALGKDTIKYEQCPECEGERLVECVGETGRGGVEFETCGTCAGMGKVKYGLKDRIKLARKISNSTDPSHKQKVAGNYRKGVVALRGLQISIETPKGAWRHYAGELGKKQQMTADYGYIKGSKEAKDGGKVDVFIGPDPKSDIVYVVDQLDKTGTHFDEHKVMIGWYCLKEAKQGYLSNYEKGWKGMGPVTMMTFSQFKHWLEKGDMKKPMSSQKQFF